MPYGVCEPIKAKSNIESNLYIEKSTLVTIDSSVAAIESGQKFPNGKNSLGN